MHDIVHELTIDATVGGTAAPGPKNTKVLIGSDAVTPSEVINHRSASLNVLSPLLPIQR